MGAEKVAAKMFSDPLRANGKAGILIRVSVFTFSSGFSALFCLGLFRAMYRNAFGSGLNQWESWNPDPRVDFWLSLRFFVLYGVFWFCRKKRR